MRRDREAQEPANCRRTSGGMAASWTTIANSATALVAAGAAIAAWAD